MHRAGMSCASTNGAQRAICHRPGVALSLKARLACPFGFLHYSSTLAVAPLSGCHALPVCAYLASIDGSGSHEPSCRLSSQPTHAPRDKAQGWRVSTPDSTFSTTQDTPRARANSSPRSDRIAHFCAASSRIQRTMRCLQGLPRYTRILAVKKAGRSIRCSTFSEAGAL